MLALTERDERKKFLDAEPDRLVMVFPSAVVAPHNQSEFAP
jgi:hypothetical protein